LKHNARLGRAYLFDTEMCKGIVVVDLKDVMRWS
ncbi:hypothetical protein Tco_1510587, partial [Tanacetum coccineum]